MPLLLETIQVKNRQLQHISYHNQRFNRSRKELLGIEEEADLAHLMRAYLHKNFKTAIAPHTALITIQHLNQNQVYKCRILYDTQIRKVEFVPYTFKKINSLQSVHADDFSYSHKFADRSGLQSLLQKKGRADEILILQNGLVTDTSYSNIAFFDGHEWFTPSKPLLGGTKRAALLEEKKIMEADISPKDLKNFEKLRLVNAMMDWEEGLEVTVDCIL
ncbi:MAG: aminotransferase class IV [Chitinophagales bacterium]